MVSSKLLIVYVAYCPLCIASGNWNNAKCTHTQTHTPHYMLVDLIFSFARYQNYDKKNNYNNNIQLIETKTTIGMVRAPIAFA